LDACCAALRQLAKGDKVGSSPRRHRRRDDLERVVVTGKAKAAIRSCQSHAPARAVNIQLGKSRRLDKTFHEERLHGTDKGLDGCARKNFKAGEAPTISLAAVGAGPG